MSRSNSKSKSQKKNSTQVYDEEKVDEILENITLKKPRSMYTHFCLEEIAKFRKKNKNEKIVLKTYSAELAKKWKELSDKEKDKYKEKFEEDKAKFKQDLDIVRHFLFKDFNDVVRRPPTAYRIYLNEKLREGFEKNKDPKEVKSKASRDWRMMSDDERQVYMDKKKDNDDWFEKAKNTRKVTALSLFVRNTIQAAKDKKKDIPQLKEIAPLWKKLSSSEKKKYKDYADDINKEREQLQDVYELVHGIKPKKPAGAFRVFLQEKAKDKTLHSIQEGKDLWNKLSEDEKEEYLRKAHRCKLAYKYKNMIFKKKIKKMLPKRPANAFAQFLKEKKGQKLPKGQTPGEYWKEDYENLPKEKKKKYVEKAESEKEKYLKKMDQFKNYVFDLPKRPLNAFSLYVRDRIPDLKQENEKAPTTKLIKMVAKEWKEEDGVSQSKYEKKAEQDRKRFSRQMKEFEKLGYYKKNSRGERTKKDEDEEEDEEEEEEVKSKKKMKKRGSSTASKSTRKGTKKTKSRSKSKSKTQESKRKRSMSKSKKKTGKTQKKK
jgi:hypothetical protein